MRITDLIAQLTAIKNEQGDLEIEVAAGLVPATMRVEFGFGSTDPEIVAINEKSFADQKAEAKKCGVECDWFETRPRCVVTVEAKTQVVSEECPGCGCLPGDGKTPGCNDPMGCGFEG